jgi:hypothetical protein
MKTSFDARDHYPDFDLPTSCCPATIIQSAVSREAQERETQAEMRFFPSGLRIFHGLMQEGHPKQTLAEPCLFGDPWPFNQSNYRGVEVSTVVCVEHEPLKVFHDLAGTPIRVKRKDSDLMPLENRPKGRFSFLDTLIFCDDRHRTAHVELVAEADLNLVLVDRAVRVEGRARQAGERCKPYSGKPGGRNCAEIGIAVFGEDRPIVGDSIVDAAPTVQPTRVFEKLFEPTMVLPLPSVPSVFPTNE